MARVTSEERPVLVGFGETPIRAGGGGPIGGGFMLAAGFPVVVEDPAIGFHVEMRIAAIGGQLKAESLSISQPDGASLMSTPVDWRLLRRLPIDHYVREVLRQLGPTLIGSLLLSRISIASSAVLTGTLTPESNIGGLEERRRYRRSVDAMADVVRLYREALESDDPKVRRAPTKYVVDKQLYGPGHTKRLLTEARKQHLLGSAPPGRGGESTN